MSQVLLAEGRIENAVILFASLRTRSLLPWPRVQGTVWSSMFCSIYIHNLCLWTWNNLICLPLLAEQVLLVMKDAVSNEGFCCFSFSFVFHKEWRGISRRVMCNITQGMPPTWLWGDSPDSSLSAQQIIGCAGQIILCSDAGKECVKHLTSSSQVADQRHGSRTRDTVQLCQCLTEERARDEGRRWILLLFLRQCWSAPGKMQVERRQGSDLSRSWVRWGSHLKWAQIRWEFISSVNPYQEGAPVLYTRSGCMGCRGAGANLTPAAVRLQYGLTFPLPQYSCGCGVAVPRTCSFSRLSQQVIDYVAKWSIRNP